MYNRVTLGILFSVLLFMVHSTWSVYDKKVESEEMKERSLASVSTLRVRSLELQEKIDSLSTEQGIEEEVRSKFSVAKDNENLVIIVKEESSSSVSVKNESFWDTFKNLFR